MFNKICKLARKHEFFRLRTAFFIGAGAIFVVLFIDMLIEGDSTRTIMGIFVAILAVLFSFYFNYEKIFLGDVVIVDRVRIDNNTTILYLKNIGCNPIYTANINIKLINTNEVSESFKLSFMQSGEIVQYKFCTDKHFNEINVLEYTVTMNKFGIFCQFLITQNMDTKGRIYVLSRTKCDFSTVLYIRFPVVFQCIIFILMIYFAIDRGYMVYELIKYTPVAI